MLDLKGGGDLRFYLRKRLIFEESDVAFYVACIGSALEFIHSRNILHRDVKPENIILDSRGYPHLTGKQTKAEVADFRLTLSRIITSRIKSGVCSNTKIYNMIIKIHIL